jgi:hypothetical protein
MSTAREEFLLVLEHSPDEGMLPLICPDTGRPLGTVIADLHSLLEERGIALSFEETVATTPPGRSRRLLVDGRPLEEIVAPHKSHRPCAGCTCCGGEPAECGECGDEAVWEDLPESVIRLAVLKAAGMKK